MLRLFLLLVFAGPTDGEDIKISGSVEERSEMGFSHLKIGPMLARVVSAVLPGFCRSLRGGCWTLAEKIFFAASVVGDWRRMRRWQAVSFHLGRLRGSKGEKDRKINESGSSKLPSLDGPCVGEWGRCGAAQDTALRSESAARAFLISETVLRAEGEPSSSPAQRLCAYAYATGGDVNTATQLLLGSGNPSDELRALALAGTYSKGSLDSETDSKYPLLAQVSREVARRRIAEGDVELGAQMLLQLGRPFDACSSLQKAGKWVYAARVAAACGLSGVESEVLMSAWASQLKKPTVDLKPSDLKPSSGGDDRIYAWLAARDSGPQLLLKVSDLLSSRGELLDACLVALCAGRTKNPRDTSGNAVRERLFGQLEKWLVDDCGFALIARALKPFFLVE